MAKRGRPPLLAGKEDEVVAMYLGGATIPDIEEHFGVSDSPIVRILDAAGVKRRIGRPAGRPNGRLPEPMIPDPTVPDIRAPDRPNQTGRRETRYRVPSTGPRASKALQDEVFRRDGYRCRMCGSGKRLTVEFAIPPEKGGDPKDPRHLRTVCATCVAKPVEKPGLIRRLFSR